MRWMAIMTQPPVRAADTRAMRKALSVRPLATLPRFEAASIGAPCSRRSCSEAIVPMQSRTVGRPLP